METTPLHDEIVRAFRSALGENLYSLGAYGSVARGDAVEGVSDINLLIILNDSNPAAHEAISGVLAGYPLVEPFILGRRGLARSEKAFAPKFLSIQRNYIVLAGADPLRDMKIDPRLEKFLCEQALRNLRLRLAHAFVVRQRAKSYPALLAGCGTLLILRLSEAVRLNGGEVPREVGARPPILAREFGLEEKLLRELLELKRRPVKLSDELMIAWHERLFPAMDKVIAWIEQKWPE